MFKIDTSSPQITLLPCTAGTSGTTDTDFLQPYAPTLLLPVTTLPPWSQPNEIDTSAETNNLAKIQIPYRTIFRRTRLANFSLALLIKVLLIKIAWTWQKSRYAADLLKHVSKVITPPGNRSKKCFSISAPLDDLPPATWKNAKTLVG